VRRVLDGGLPVSLGGAAGTLAAYLEYARLADDAQTRQAGSLRQSDAGEREGGGGGGGGGDTTTSRRPGEPAGGASGAVGDRADYAERLVAAFAAETGL